MKRIITLLTLIFSAVILSFNYVNAIPIEKNYEFTISSFNTSTEYPNLNVIANTNKSTLQQDLADIFALAINESPEQQIDIQLTKNGVTYPAKLKYYILSGYPDMYEINTSINGWPLRFELWSTSYTLGGKTIQPNQIDVFANDLMMQSKLDILSGTWKITGTVEGNPDPEDGINVSNNFDLIPSTIGTLESAAYPETVGYVYFEHSEDNLFNVYIMLLGRQYNLGLIELPGVSELNQMPLSPGIYWTENNKRHIYYEFQQPASVKPISEQFNAFLDDPTQIKGFRPFVTMNLTDSTYTFTDKLELYAGFYGGQNGQAYADVVFPFEIDKLLSIEIDYQYRWQILWGLSYTSWTDVNITRYIDQVVDMRSTWQHVTRLITGFSVGLMSTAVSGWDSTIEEIQVNSIYRSDYVDNINKVRLSQGKTALTQSQVFPANADIFRVYLDTYSDGRYTGYEINDDIVIVDVMYEVDGTIYHVGYEDIKQGGSFGGGGPGLGGQDQPKWDWSFITSIFENIPIEYLVIGLFALYVVFYKPINSIFKNIKKIISNPKELLIFAILVGGLLFYMGYL